MLRHVVALVVAATAAPAALTFDELLVPSPRELVPSVRAASLAGQRVRMVGYMARLEEPTPGGFFLAARPIVCDEAGAGIGDLPPNAVFVVMRSYEGRDVPFTAGPLEVTGRLDLGPRTESDGRVTQIRIFLDSGNAQEAPAGAPRPSSSTTQAKEKP